MAIKTYGKIVFDYGNNEIVISEAEPHICIRLKNIFMRIPTVARPPYKFKNTPEICADLLWFMKRYPLEMTESTSEKLEEGQKKYVRNVNEIESIHMPGYESPAVILNDGFQARDYQVKAAQTHVKVKRLLLGDDLGLGKTLSGILTFLNEGTLPAVVVVQTHMTKQWKDEGIEKFTGLKAHIIKGTKPYDLPKADVYILKYSCLAGWVDIYDKGFFKSAVFDECQEFRRSESLRYQAGVKLSESVEYTLGLSATPVYNFGDEIFNVLNLINPDCLGKKEEFLREWTIPHGMHYKVRDPKALGSYLRERFLFLRRTRSDVGRELPMVNKIIHTVDYDHVEVKKFESLAKMLAMKIVSGSFTERGEAARELDMLARHNTGISKAKYVAEYVRILLENDEPVVLALWHRDVYTIILEELKEYNPVMYTGTESANQKEKAKQAFMNGETKLFIISLRSGSGLDGLQHICSNVVFGELDWSPKVHDQVIGRVDRDGRDTSLPVTAHFLVSDSGSDPVIINLLGLKASQANGIVDPLSLPAEQYSDESRMKLLAQQYLTSKEMMVEVA